MPSWHRLSQQQRSKFEQNHVDLMLETASQHHLRRLEGFRLISPQGGWERFWLIEFPTISGAEAWIDAEMAPPYGRYGFYDYQLARQILPNTDPWLSRSTAKVTPMEEDPHTIPPLTIDKESIVVFQFMKGEQIKQSSLANRSETDQIGELANRLGAIRLEQFKLIAPNHNWDRVWLVELHSHKDAEVFMEAAVDSGRGDRSDRSFLLTRKWAPAYFASWIPR